MEDRAVPRKCPPGRGKKTGPRADIAAVSQEPLAKSLEATWMPDKGSHDRGTTGMLAVDGP